MQPPQGLWPRFAAANPEATEIGDHQREDQQSNDARFSRQGSEPFRADHKASHKQTCNRDHNQNGKSRSQVKIDLPENAEPGEERKAENRTEVVQRHYRKHAESPKHEGM